jgi:hypothetical protein
MMSKHQKQTAFPRQCLLYDDTAERHQLEERITRLQLDERWVRRAVGLARATPRCSLQTIP